MDYLSLIKLPIEAELADFIDLFNKSLMHSDGLLSQVLDHIRQRAGKRMRPILILLMARNFGKVSSVTQHSAVGLELLHTASLVHDDVVDESGERRGQASVNATYNNKVAVLDIDTFCTLCKIEKRGSARYLKEVTKGLRDQSFWMETEEGVYETFSWVEKISINEKKGKITLRFSNDMKPFLLNLQSDFTSYKLPMVLRFSSRYTNIVFDLIYSKFGQNGRKSGSLEILVDEMKERIQIKKDKRTNRVVNQNISFKDLRVRILEPTLEEINKFTDIMVDAEYIKNGRKTELIRFNFRKKTKHELENVPPFSENRIDLL